MVQVWSLTQYSPVRPFTTQGILGASKSSVDSVTDVIETLASHKFKLPPPKVKKKKKLLKLPYSRLISIHYLRKRKQEELQWWSLPDLGPGNVGSRQGCCLFTTTGTAATSRMITIKSRDFFDVLRTIMTKEVVTSVELNKRYPNKWSFSI